MRKTGEYLPFKEARKLIRGLGFKSKNEWNHFKLKKLFKLPYAPNDIYKDEWVNWPDFLGDSYENSIYFHKLTFDDARKQARDLNCPSQHQWRILATTGELPPGMPKRPDIAYKGLGWAGWRDFLNTKNILPYKEAREFIKRYSFTSSVQWWEVMTNASRPSFLPGNPPDYYKKRGWCGWPHFLSKID